MAISIKKQPQELTPVYNQMLIAATSSSDSEPNFQFVTDLVVRGETSSRIKIPVNPEGYGVFDIHRHIQNEITFDFNPESLYFNTATNSFATYSAFLSEEYRNEWRFIDNLFITGSFVGFVGYGLPFFGVGEEISILQDGGATYLSYNGDTIVTGITATASYGTFSGDLYIVETNKTYLGSSAVNPGSIFLSNRRLYITPIQASFSKWAFNGVESFVDFINYDYETYNATWSGSEFLTNVPDNWKVDRESNMWLNLWSDDINKVHKAIITTETNEIEIINDKTSQNLQLGVGTNQLQFEAFTIGSTASLRTLSRTAPIVRTGDMISATNSYYTVRVIGEMIDNATKLSEFNGATLTLNDEDGPDGSVDTAFKVDFVDPNTAPSNGVRTLSLRTPITAGNTYRVSVWAKSVSATASFRFLYSDPVTISPNNDITDQWGYYSYTFTTGSPVTVNTIRLIPKAPTPTPEGGYSVYFWNLNVEIDTIEPKTFIINDKCSRYEKIQLIFLDKRGSFIPYTFNMVNRNNKTISRSTFQQNYGRFAPASNDFEYNTWDRGVKTLDVVTMDEWVVNSDWVNQNESDFLMTLFESPEVFWYKENGDIIAVNIKTTNIERKQVLNDLVINYTLTFETSMKDRKQNG